MNLLLDTHAWLWFALGDARLSASAKSAILDPANSTFVSPASHWEISIKTALGKYVLASPYKRFMNESITGNGFSHLHVSTDHTQCVSTLAFPFGEQHRDPFDRLLISPAIVEGMHNVTGDARFGA